MSSVAVALEWFPLVFAILGYLTHKWLNTPFFFRIGFYHPGRIIHSNGYNYRYSCCENGVGPIGYDASKYGIRGCSFGLDLLSFENVVVISTPNPQGEESHWVLPMCVYVLAYFILKFVFIVACGITAAAEVHGIVLILFLSCSCMLVLIWLLRLKNTSINERQQFKPRTLDDLRELANLQNESYQSLKRHLKIYGA